MLIFCDFFPTATRNKDSDESKKEPMDGSAKTALGRRASGVTTKMSKPGEQVLRELYLPQNTLRSQHNNTASLLIQKIIVTV